MEIAISAPVPLISADRQPRLAYRLSIDSDVGEKYAFDEQRTWVRFDLGCPERGTDGSCVRSNVDWTVFGLPPRYGFGLLDHVEDKRVVVTLQGVRTVLDSQVERSRGDTIIDLRATPSWFGEISAIEPGRYFFHGDDFLPWRMELDRGAGPFVLVRASQEVHRTGQADVWPQFPPAPRPNDDSRGQVPGLGRPVLGSSDSPGDLVRSFSASDSDFRSNLARGCLLFYGQSQQPQPGAIPFETSGPELTVVAGTQGDALSWRVQRRTNFLGQTEWSVLERKSVQPSADCAQLVDVGDAAIDLLGLILGVEESLGPKVHRLPQAVVGATNQPALNPLDSRVSYRLMWAPEHADIGQVVVTYQPHWVTYDPVRDVLLEARVAPGDSDRLQW